MTLLGIDFGRKKIGLAYSDETELVAAPLETLRVNNLDEAVAKIKEVKAKLQAGKIILGFPTSVIGVESPEMRLIKKFAVALEQALKLEVKLWDETYSSKRAEFGARGRKRANSDSEAARIILQEYLDDQNERRKHEQA